MKDIFPRKGFNYMKSKGRAVLHREVVPKFASFFKNGDNIVEVGKHIFWDYSPFFVNPNLLCNFLTIDTKPGLLDQQDQTPLTYSVDDICNSKLKDGWADGFLFIGMHDGISDPQAAYDEMHRILKPGGRILVAFPGTGARCGGELVNQTEWYKFLNKFQIDSVHYVYGPEDEQRYTEGKNTSILVIARKFREEAP